MENTYGTEQLKKIVEAAAEGMNVAEKILNKGGLFVLFQLTDEVSALGTIDKVAIKQELAELSSEERDELKAVFASKLDLKDDVLEAKIESGADILDDAIEVVSNALEIVNRTKSLFS